MVWIAGFRALSEPSVAGKSGDPFGSLPEFMDFSATLPVWTILVPDKGSAVSFFGSKDRK